MIAARLAPFVLGAVVLGSLVAALFFVRFYRDTRDPLFLYFAGAFGLEGVNRTILVFSQEPPSEAHPIFYVLRALAYSVILLGICLKNRRSR